MTGTSDRGGNAPGSDKTYDNYYLKLRRIVRDYTARHAGSTIADMLLYVPDFFYLLVKLAADPQVPRGNKTQIVAALAYFLSPLDVIPDAVPGLGLLDDLYLAMIVTDNLITAAGPDLVLRYWPGDADVAAVISSTLHRLNDKLGMGAIRRILDRLKNTDDVPPESEPDDPRNNP